ncbi:MAG: hypothetical protein ACREQV_26500 [Candidatus Binatia bacterium]
MYQVIKDIEALLTASRDLLGPVDLDVKRLQAWGAERKIIFGRLKDHNPTLAGVDPSEVASLLRELLDIDGTVCTRLIENQRSIGEQIGAARKLRQALEQGSTGAPQLLQRLA